MASHAIDKLPRPARTVLDAVNAAYVLAARRAVILRTHPSSQKSAQPWQIGWRRLSSLASVSLHRKHLIIDHQLQTVPAPIAAIMSGASPCPMLTVCGDEQEKRVPAHRSSHRPCVLLFQSFFPVSQREQNLGGDRQMLTVHELT